MRAVTLQTHYLIPLRSVRLEQHTEWQVDRQHRHHLRSRAGRLRAARDHPSRGAQDRPPRHVQLCRRPRRARARAPLYTLSTRFGVPTAAVRSSLHGVYFRDSRQCSDCARVIAMRRGTGSCCAER